MKTQHTPGPWLPTPEQLAVAFIAEIRASLSPEEIAIVNERNTLPEYQNACATHDFCDANVCMADAFEKLTGVPPDETSSDLSGSLMPGMDDSVVSVWNSAWSIAINRKFTADTLKPV